jgi:hypothetical protein
VDNAERLTAGQNQYQRDLNDARESASAERKIETMLTYVLPSAETAAMLFCGPVTVRKVGGWQSLVETSTSLPTRSLSSPHEAVI